MTPDQITQLRRLLQQAKEAGPGLMILLDKALALLPCSTCNDAEEFTKRILAYCRKASPEPWYWKSNRDIGKGTFDLLSEKQEEFSFGILGDADFEGSRFGGIITPQTIANQKFIVNARIDLPEACRRLNNQS